MQDETTTATSRRRSSIAEFTTVSDTQDQTNNGNTVSAFTVVRRRSSFLTTITAGAAGGSGTAAQHRPYDYAPIVVPVSLSLDDNDNAAAAATATTAAGREAGEGGGGRETEAYSNAFPGDYLQVVRDYPAYRAYLVAHTCQQFGDWFVRIASILMVEELATAANNAEGLITRSAQTGHVLAYLTLARLLPNAIGAPVGGILADRYSRRTIMIVLDLISGMVVLGYLVAAQAQSLSWFYIVTIVRSALVALYYPSTTGIVPLLLVQKKTNNHNTTHNQDTQPQQDQQQQQQQQQALQLAITINGSARSLCAILGGGLAGTMTARIGLQSCYVIDCCTFWLSALILTKYIPNDDSYRVATSTTTTTSSITPRPNQNQNQSTAHINTNDDDDDRNTDDKDDDDDDTSIFPTGNSTNDTVRTGGGRIRSRVRMGLGMLQHVYGDLREVGGYLLVCGFGMLVFAKPSASFVWGIEDIVGAQFSTVYATEESTQQEDEAVSSRHMGMLFSIIGAGNMFGPILFNVQLFTDARRPYTLQRACWIGLVFLTSGWFLISMARTFPQFLMGSFIRTMGSGAVWVNSAIILQTLCNPQILGRILAVEYTLTTLFEAASCAMTGRLSSVVGLSKNQLALFGAGLGILMVLFWGLYYYLSLGAAHPKFNNNYYYQNGARGEHNNPTSRGYNQLVGGNHYTQNTILSSSTPSLATLMDQLEEVEMGTIDNTTKINKDHNRHDDDYKVQFNKNQKVAVFV